MGCICPTERKVPSESSSNSSQEQEESLSLVSPELATETSRINLSLRADEYITRLVGPFSLYYRTLSTISQKRECAVLKAEYLSTKQKCVIRRLMKAATKKDRKSIRYKLASEAELLLKLDHPHILRTLELLQDYESVFIVSELYEGGSLQSVLNSEGVLTERQSAVIMHQILSGLNYSHLLAPPFIYLTLENIVLQERLQDSNLVSKLVPYNTAEALILEKELVHGLSFFLAPEVTHRKRTEKCDVWSCGVILSYMITGTSPFIPVPKGVECNEATMYCGNFGTQQWKSKPKDLVSLVEAMVAVNPKERLSVSECIAHPWIQRLSGELSIRSRQVRTSLSALRSSQECTTLKEAVMRFIISRVIQEKEINELAESFMALDINKDGVISYDELLDGYKRMMTDVQAKAEADKVMKAADKDGNGQIDYSEFLLSSFSKNRLLSKENLKVAFNSLDEDGSGQISLQELKKVFALKSTEEGEAQWRQLILEADTSGDGEIDFFEFVNLMTLQINKA